MAAKCCSSPAINAGSAFDARLSGRSNALAIKASASSVPVEESSRISQLPPIVRLRPVIVRRDRGLAASPPVGYTLKMEGSKTPLHFFLPPRRSPSAVAVPVHERAIETALAGQGRLGWRRRGALGGDRLVVVGALDRVDDLLLGVVVRALDHGYEPDQHAVAHHLRFQRGGAVGVP